MNFPLSFSYGRNILREMGPWSRNCVIFQTWTLLWRLKDKRTCTANKRCIKMSPQLYKNSTFLGGMIRLNTLRPRQNGRHFADDIFKCIFLNENVRISIKISLKFVLKDPINNIPALVQIIAWCRPGDKPLSEPMMVSLLTHICVTRPQRVNILGPLKLSPMSDIIISVFVKVNTRMFSNSRENYSCGSSVQYVSIGFANGIVPWCSGDRKVYCSSKLLYRALTHYCVASYGVTVLHLKATVSVIPTLASLVALEVVVTPGATTDDKVGIMIVMEPQWRQNLASG